MNGSESQLGVAQQLIRGDIEGEGGWEETSSTITNWLTKDTELQTAAVECLCCKLLPTASAEQLETLKTGLWVKVEAFLVSLCEKCRHLLAEGKDGEEEGSKICRHLHCCVTSFVGCAEAVWSSHPPLSLTSIAVVGHVLQLCKDVETDCPSAFTHLSSDLATLFKAIFSLLKVTVEALGGLCSEQRSLEMANLTLALLRLGCVCRVAVQFDASLLVLVWRCVGKMACAGRPHLLAGEWSVQPLMADLCTALEAKGRECVESAPPQGSEVMSSALFNKLLRTCRFLVTLLVKLTKEFEERLYEFAKDLFLLLLKLYSSTPPSPHAKSVSQDCLSQFESNVLIVAEPLITTLVNCEKFLQLMTSRADVLPGCEYGWTMCLSSILKLFPTLSDGLQDYLMEPDSSSEASSSKSRLLDSVFTCTMLCSLEHSLPTRVPGVMCSGQPQRAVTLHEHVSIHFCALVAGLPARHFGKLEVVLLRNLLGCDLPCSLLASDVWCFMARWGPSEVCSRHTHLLASLVVSLCPSSSLYSLPLLSLVTRILALLTEQQQLEFVQAFPPTRHENLILWAHIQFSSLSPSLLTEVCQTVATSSLELLRDLLCVGTCNLHTPSALAALSAVLTLPSLPSLLPTSFFHSIVESLMELWDTVLVGQPAPGSELLLTVQCQTIELVSLLLVHLQPSHTLKVFRGLEHVVTSPSPALGLSLATFLHCCRALQVASDIQTEVLQSLALLFRQLLGHTHWLVHHCALEAFRAFAEVTPYTDVVEQCIPADLSNIVVGYLHQVPRGSQHLKQLPLTSLLQQRVAQLHQWKQQRSCDQTTGSHDQASRSHDQASRSHESTDEEVLSELIVLQSTWERVVSLCSSSSPPQGIRTQLLALAKNMTDFVSMEGRGPS